MPRDIELDVEPLREALRKVIDPELGLDIVTLGLVYEILPSEQGDVSVRMTMTSRGCPMQGIIAASAKSVLQSQPDVRHAEIEVVWEPPWTPERIDPKGREQLGF